ncbi:transcriptional regulator [Rhodococcoides trifolii]|uniref:Transcriptional regulator n=1 Tax=Rhodococcoides trifolii TaxID=908250 RepID=A0A917CY45_9NOCA|nr:GAF and ANTAR domain-containing protein [Rhodococcus trifolii]GGG02088.1 transcriptional regulator [Rhodococcus trifolii]
MADSAPIAEAAAVFAGLGKVVYRGSTADDVYDAIANAAATLVDGCDHASIMMRQGDVYRTVAASDDVARQVDELERATGEGPCLDAIIDESAQVEPDFRGVSEWPRLARAVVESTPVRGAMGFRLLIDSRKVGALNLFTDTPGVFTTESVEQAVLMTAFASVAATAVAKGEQAESLRQGMLSNREIGKAIGLLMALHDIDDDTAFDLLRRTSQDMNVKVIELARRIIEQHRGEGRIG